MDPLTIATAAVSITKLCSQIYTFIRDMTSVDKSISVLIIEIESLSTVLIAIGNTFNDSVQVTVALSSPIVSQHWQNIQKMLEDCKEALQEFESITENINQSGTQILLKPVQLISLKNSTGKITLIKQKLAAYREMLNMSLHCIF